MTRTREDLKEELARRAGVARDHREQERCALETHRKAHGVPETQWPTARQRPHPAAHPRADVLKVPPQNGHCEEYAMLRRRWVGPMRWAYRLHHLAYGFLRGVAYAAMELRCQVEPDFAEVHRIAMRFGGDEAAWGTWRRAAEEHLAGAPPAPPPLGAEVVVG